MARQILANQAIAAKRRVFFHCVDATDGITAETGEAGGQPQISTNGAAFTSTGIGTLVFIGNGRYYAELTQSAVAIAGTLIETRYKSAATAETPGDQVHVVGYDPDASMGSQVDSVLAAAHGAGSWQTGGSTGAQQITVTVEDQFAIPVPGVALAVYDATNSVFQFIENTGPSGTAVVNLDSGTWVIRQSASMYAPDNAAETLVVTVDAPVTFTGTRFAPSAPPTPSQCTIFGTLSGAGGVHANAQVEAYAIVPSVVGGFQMTKLVASTITDAGGYFEMPLERNAVVKLVCVAAGLDVTRKVPDALSQDVSTWTDVVEPS